MSMAILNKGYKFTNGGGPVGADVALLVLDTPSSVTPTPVYDNNDEVGKTITIIGWGDSKTAGGSMPEDG